MHIPRVKRAGAIFFAAVLALAGCSGEDGDPGAPGADGAAGADGTTGPQGPQGPAGQDLVASAKPESCAVCHRGAGKAHQDVYNLYTDAPTLAATIVSVESTYNEGSDPATYKSVVTFTLTKDGVPYGDATLSGLAQKRYMGTKYDPATRTFETASAISYGGLKQVAAGTYTVEAAAAKFAPEDSDSFIYFYFSEKDTIVPPSGHYALYQNVASIAKAYGTVDFVSAANVEGCEKCHGSPYQKHGYRAGAVAGIPDMVACKACHHDQRVGTHRDWQCLVDDPAAYAAATCETKPEWPAYAYVATTMNDTHMSHAMEFAYPQSMANCVTCHEGKLDMILADSQFTLATCKSCHPVTGVGGTDPKRAPALKDLLASVASFHPADLYTAAGDCNLCHKAGGTARTFAALHPGYSEAIYASEGVRYSETVTSSVTSASFDAATNVLTVDFAVEGAAANAIVKPTVVVSLYGYGTKDFIVSGHGSAADGKRNLEWAEGNSRNGPRLTVAPAAATAGNTTWTATVDLSTWAAMLADGTVKRAEIGFLPYVGLDQTVAAGGANPYIAVAGVTKTFDLVGKALLADDDAKAYGRAIVDAGKCNACHDALATTFHSPAYGSAGVVGCRLCHVGLSGGSHLEMQSRSIDSYVHAIHAMQPFDIGDVDFTDPVAATRYAHHIESTYPNFTLLNCESCHNPGTYEAPDNSRSLPGLHSKADVVATWDRNIGAVPAYVTGPGSRACGGCHRAKAINEDNAGELAAFNEHTGTFGYLLEGTTEVLDAAIAKVMAYFK